MLNFNKKLKFCCIKILLFYKNMRIFESVKKRSLT